MYGTIVVVEHPTGIMIGDDGVIVIGSITGHHIVIVLTHTKKNLLEIKAASDTQELRKALDLALWTSRGRTRIQEMVKLLNSWNLNYSMFELPADKAAQIIKLIS